MEKIEELAIRNECVGILTGLNLSREIVTHYAQETLFKSSASLAEKLNLPLVMHLSNPASLDRAIEILREENIISDDKDVTSNMRLSKKLILHDALTSCGFNTEKLNAVVGSSIFCMINGTPTQHCFLQTFSKYSLLFFIIGFREWVM